MDKVSDVHVIEREKLNKFDCPNCGSEIRSPYGGHTWTCHESYGGCGAKYKPVDAFKRVE